MEKICVYRELGLSDSEYQKILDILKREPTVTELAMFSVEWSEHCGYPRSRAWFSIFPREGKYPTLLGTDAGGIKFGEHIILFKMESHNHPSQVEPFQGAATGIGGIIRDIVSMGARPIALMDSLRFSEKKSPRNDHIINEVINGISFYGNCVGVPTVGGEIYYHKSYEGNCLVNVFCAGVACDAELAPNKAVPGNPVLVLGSRTGRDGIGGCSTLASAEFGTDDKKRPSVQIGDPFAGKCLIEATLEALASGAILAMKDMGAAGLTCTTSELSASNNIGMEVELLKVPLREKNMQPYEIMMSESQERMLAVAQKGREKEVIDIFHKWGLEGEVVGITTSGNTLTIKYFDEVVAQIPVKELTHPPVYELPYEAPDYYNELKNFDISGFKKNGDYNFALKKITQKKSALYGEFAYRRYDHMVQVNTIVKPGEAGAAVVRIDGTNKGIGLTCDCNSLYVYLDPYKGSQMAIAEAARNLVCVGADPAGVTDCLNFGNPEKKDRYWQFVRSVEGIADACKSFNIPVVSGNVSFYNESADGPIYPTPSIGMIGVIEDVEKTCTSSFKNAGDLIVLIGDNTDEVGASLYLKEIYGIEAGVVPELNLEKEKKVQNVCLKAVQSGLLNSAHDCSDGGLALCLYEKCVLGSLGAKIELPKVNSGILFGEAPSRIIVSLNENKLNGLWSLAAEEDINLHVLGRVTSDDKFIIKSKEKEIISITGDWHKPSRDAS